MVKSILTLSQAISYFFLAIVLGYLLSDNIFFGLWISVSLILAIRSKDDDNFWLKQILVLIILGPVGRFLAPGNLIGSLWGFDFLVAFGLVIRLWQNRISWPKKDTAWYFLVFSLIGLISSSFIFPFAAVLKGSLYSLRWLGYYLVVNGIKGIEGLKGRYIGIIGTVLAMFGFIQILALPAIPNTLVAKYAFDPHVYRLFSTWVDPNYLAGFLVISLLLNLNGIKGVKGLKGRYIGIIGLGILLTFSRSGWLALLAGLLVYLCYKAPKLILSFVIGVILLVNFVSPIRQRVQGVLDLDITAKQRLASWNQAWQVIKVNPIIGVGYSSYSQAATTLRQSNEKKAIAYNPALGGSDSSLLTIWATAGIGGLIIYLLIIGKIWQTGTVEVKASIASLVVHSLFVNSLLLPPFLILFWLIRKMGEKR